MGKEEQRHFGASRFREWAAKVHVVKKLPEQILNTHHNLSKPQASSEENTERNSLLDTIREQLHENPGVFVAGEFVEKRSEEQRKASLHEVAEVIDIIVAPHKPTYEPKQLNQFVNSLVGGEETTMKDEAEIQRGKLEIAHLFFDEYTLGTWDKRRIGVRIYPETVSAQTMYEYRKGLQNQTLKPALNGNLGFLRHWIYKEDIEELKKGKNPFKNSFTPRKRGSVSNPLPKEQ